MKRANIIAPLCAALLLSGCSIPGIELPGYSDTKEECAAKDSSEDSSKDESEEDTKKTDESNEDSSKEDESSSDAATEAETLEEEEIEESDSEEKEYKLVNVYGSGAPSYKSVNRSGSKLSDDGKKVDLCEKSQNAIMVVADLEDEYPELAKTLKASADTMLDNYDSEFEEMYGMAKSQYESDPDYFGEYYDDEHQEITRSDSMVLSILETEDFYGGGVHGYYAVYGYNYYVSNGEEISLGDVVSVSEDEFATIIKADLIDNAEDGEGTFFDLDESLSHYKYDPDEKKSIESGAEDYELGYNWYMTIDGIHIVFNQYDIADYASGSFEVVFDYDEEIVNENLGFDTSRTYCYKEEIPFYESENEAYEDENYIIYNSQKSSFVLVYGDGSAEFDDYYGEETGAYNVYHFVMDDGREYIHLSTAFGNDYYDTYVFDVTDGGCEKVDIFGYTGVWIDVDTEYSGPKVLSSADSFIIVDTSSALGTFTYYNYYSIGDDGMPQADPKTCVIVKVSTEDIVSAKSVKMEKLDDSLESTGDMITVQSGTGFTIVSTDGVSFVDLLSSDGQYLRLYIDNIGYEGTVDGVSIQDIFPGLEYVG
ncbi:RsiV family protein [Butyrivibrio fibrisolvens]|uniref:RsiV family protein n=1 Tax=Butyrivibrio fibrisolvens TaxID=831 RepID=UPI0020C095A4|nr:RsiV family protein [Butyrivibrio fibrisolvens]